ncbi:MAG: hypothetical protein IPK79_05770 [Vampirovibrionales bacterium]|nr:hypothetical protein [Vampirovibrionales bacterium]
MGWTDWSNWLPAENYSQTVLRRADTIASGDPQATRQNLADALKQDGFTLSDQQLNQAIAAFGKSDGKGSSDQQLSNTEIAALLYAASDPQKEGVTAQSRQEFLSALNGNASDLSTFAQQKNHEAFTRPEGELGRVQVLNAVGEGGATAAKGVIGGSVAAGALMAAGVPAIALGVLGAAGTGYAGYQTYQGVDAYQKASANNDAEGKLTAIADITTNGSLGVLGVAGGVSALRGGVKSPGTSAPASAKSPVTPQEPAPSAPVPPPVEAPPVLAPGSGGATKIVQPAGPSSGSANTAPSTPSIPAPPPLEAPPVAASATPAGPSTTVSAPMGRSPRLTRKIEAQQAKLEKLTNEKATLPEQRLKSAERTNLQEAQARLEGEIKALERQLPGRARANMTEAQQAQWKDLSDKRQAFADNKAQLEQHNTALHHYNPKRTQTHIDKDIHAIERRIAKLQGEGVPPSRKARVLPMSAAGAGALLPVASSGLSKLNPIREAIAATPPTAAPDKPALDSAKPKYDFHMAERRAEREAAEKAKAEAVQKPENPAQKAIPPEKANLPPIELVSLPGRSPAPAPTATPHAPKPAALPAKPAPTPVQTPQTPAESVQDMLKRLQNQPASAGPRPASVASAPAPLPPIRLIGKSEPATKTAAPARTIAKRPPAAVNYPEPDRPIRRSIERTVVTPAPAQRRETAPVASLAARFPAPASAWDDNGIGWNNR